MIPRIPIGRDGSRTAWIDFSAVPTGWGLVRCSTDTQKVRWEKHLGFRGIVPAEDSPDPSLYLGVAPGFLWGTTGAFFLSIEYWDNSPGAFAVEYMRDVGSATPTEDDIATKCFYTGGTGRWQRQNVALWRARMENDLPFDSSIRLIPPGTPIRRVFLSRQPLGEIDRIRPWGAETEVAEPPDSIRVLVRPSDQERLIFRAGNPRFDQKMGLYASWGAEGIILELKRAELLEGKARESPAYIWASVFRRSEPGVVLEVHTAEAEQNPPNIWDTGEIERWREAARTIARIGVGRWPDGVILDLRDTVGFEPSHALQIAWDAPEIVRDFRLAVRDELGTLRRINRAWGTEYRRQEEIVPFLGSQAPSPQAARFVERWLQRRQAEFLDRVLDACNTALPRTSLFLRLPYRADWGVLDRQRLSELVHNQDVTVLTLADGFNPVLDAKWLLLARSLRQTGARLGLEIQGAESGALASGFFALSTEGGGVLILSESDLARPGVLERYRSSTAKAGGEPQPRTVGVLYPWQIDETGDEFSERFAWIRDAIPVDLIASEEPAEPASLKEYQIIVHLKGTRWPSRSLDGLEEWVRSGNLLIFAGDSALVDEQGNTETTTRLFPLEFDRSDRRLQPISRGFEGIDIMSPFEELRNAWVKEVGLGFTFYIPKANLHPAEYIALVASIARNPSVVDPRLRRGVKSNGLMDGLFQTVMKDWDLMLNLTPDEQTLSTRPPVRVPAWELVRIGE